jgi:hypothetical protein
MSYRFPPHTSPLVKEIFRLHPVRVAELMQGETYVSVAKIKEILRVLMTEHIQNDVRVRLAPRMLPDGRAIIGVFAIRDIPAGAYPFKTLLGHCFAENPLVEVPKAAPEIQDVRAFLDEFFLGTDTYPLPPTGPNGINVSYFLNHSNTPNVAIVNAPGESCEYTVYQTSRAIRAGEELTLDYRHFIHPKPKKGRTTWEHIRQQLDPTSAYLEPPETSRGVKRSFSHRDADGKSSLPR